MKTITIRYIFTIDTSLMFENIYNKTAKRTI